MAPVDDLFGVPLRADPSVALGPLRSGVKLGAGPIHRTQFVMELVGPRTVPAFSASMLLDTSWYSAFGQPQLYCMAPKDLEWQPLSDTRDGAYDSLALAWDMVGDRGSLSSSAASHLLAMGERFATQISRRAMTMPPPSEVDAQVRALTQIRDRLDAGYSVGLLPRHGAFPEKDVWVAAANLGLEFESTGGTFVWKDLDTGLTAITLAPSTDESFSLGNVQTGHTHASLVLGFHIPTNPSPSTSLAMLFRCADVLSQRLFANPIDDGGHPLTDAAREAARRNLGLAVDTLLRAGIAPGSRAALSLWRDSLAS